MIPTKNQLRNMLSSILKERNQQGHDTTAAEATLAALADSYDALIGFAGEVPELPMRPDWQYVQPETWDGIVAEMAKDRKADPIAKVDLADAARRVEAGFLASVCGCVLGKPLEINPTLDELKTAFEAIGEWPMRQYVSERVFTDGKLRSKPDCWWQTCRENIRWVAPDDDINYTVMGMLVLEQHGPGFTRNQLRHLWHRNIPCGYAWGPERMMLIRTAIASIAKYGDVEPAAMEEWVQVLNPGDELCGAQIRADAYGYACPGRPQLAAELAWRDSSWTHRLTGVYSTMFTAAAIAVAMVERDPVRVFEIALQYVPQRSRFAEVVRDAIAEVREAKDWMDGYRRINASYGEYAHCKVYQETATLVNTLRFAKDVGDGICIQVMQGNDTDSYGATAGSLLGCFFGPGHLESRWLEPFQDQIHTTLADFHEQSLSKLARRMSKLPALVHESLGKP